MPEQKKIAIFGPPIVGKTTILVAYAHARGLTMTNGPAPFAASSSIAPPRMVRTCKANEHPQVATYPGAVWAIEDWGPLLRACTALLVVLDSRETRIGANMMYVQFLREARINVKACFVFSKKDIAGLPTNELRRLLTLDEEPFCDWPIYESTIERPDTLLAPMDYLSQD